MTPHYTDHSVTLYHGDCLDILRDLPDQSVDAVVTDPPYALNFMGKEWDSFTIRKRGQGGTGVRSEWAGGVKFGTTSTETLAFQNWCELWATECLRVLKPGGHMLAFGVTRTYHRLTCAVEDAGFEIRDSIAWLYGSGFPKSLDVSKAIDKAAGAEREVVGRHVQSARTRTSGYAGEAEPMMAWQYDLTAPATDAARQWQGWGTALKPAFEPVVVARKPLAGTVSSNVLAHGTGALNVDGCRIEGAVPSVPQPVYGVKPDGVTQFGAGVGRNGTMSSAPGGRWPANVILDEHQAAALDQQSGDRPGNSNNNLFTREGKTDEIYGRYVERSDGGMGRGDSGGASRFFYTAKADAGERPVIYRPTCECEDAWPTHTPSAARATGATTELGSSSTSRSGSGTTGSESPRATRSTTSTGTSSTTDPATSSLSPLSTISASTPVASSATASGGSPAASAASSSPSALLTGISAAKVGRSTDGAGRATSRGWSATSVCGNCGSPTRREAHATVKPLNLMRWLVRLVTPPGGVVLEPFAGSGTTVEACILEGLRCIAIEREADYLPLIVQRVNRQRDPIAYTATAGEDLGLFGDLEELA